MTVPLLVVTGAVGVGKTTVAAEASELLAERDVPHAFVDMDCLTRFHPRPPGDPFGSGLALEGLRRLWRLWAGAGAARLIVAQVVEARTWLREFEEAIPGAAIVVVRLTAPVETIHERIRRRETGASLGWHLDRAVELQELWHAQPVEDVLVETEGRGARELAAEVLAAAGWL
jgi:predicted kinase